ncbi:unnamed protein product [Soboliphyme baturini]|uniref:Oxysterol-binding protein n=1 Tax=Soboliphyme baturini TaxID=241478 RepID=A0A183IMM8_9BILA|nr:unnamed protein product [Soboliphyme baturini]
MMGVVFAVEDTREHGSVIMHMISQLSVGMDLTKIVLPTYILERRSLLEMYADFMTFADLFEAINEGHSEEERMVAMLRWYMSTFYGGRKSGLAKKPYNPILGEEFRCCWNSPSLSQSEKVVPGSPFPEALANQITFVGEQVSHHPPVSAFYVEHPAKRMQVTGQIWTKSKFLGLSIAVYNVGETCLYLGDHDEEYIFNFPSAYGRSILTTPWVEFGGKCYIKCSKSGYHADIEFLTKPFYNGKAHCVRADVFRPDDKIPVLTVKGQWNDVLLAKSSQGVHYLTAFMLWRYVTAALKERDVHKATRCKFWLEQQQREEAKRRMKNNLPWVPVSFYEVRERWTYRNSLKDRLLDCAQ